MGGEAREGGGKVTQAATELGALRCFGGLRGRGVEAISA